MRPVKVISTQRNSWDTTVKHYYRNNLENTLPKYIKDLVPSSNASRWKNEDQDKYVGCQVSEYINQEIELIKRINQSSNIKRINQGYFKLCDALHEVISKVKGIKKVIKQQKEIIVDTIEQVKDIIPINKALKVFNISRSTFENYKSILIHQCESSYFKWCTRRYSNQLLPMEVNAIKMYMTNINYKFWSKSSVYIKGLRDENINCGISTFYKYCRLLGFKNRSRRNKSDDYNPVKTTRPNQIWCCDVTIFKTMDNVKHYIHFLIDHYSKMIFGYKIEKYSSGVAIKSLLQDACLKYHPDKIEFLTDGGSENVNTTVSSFIDSSNIFIKHLIAQKDVIFSNSMIESINKVIKHQFLYPKEIFDGNHLYKIMDEIVPIYNNIRPQMSLGGNTPRETQNGLTIDISRYKNKIKEQKQLRLVQNKRSNCSVCY